MGSGGRGSLQISVCLGEKEVPGRSKMLRGKSPMVRRVERTAMRGLR